MYAAWTNGELATFALVMFLWFATAIVKRYMAYREAQWEANEYNDGYDDGWEAGYEEGKAERLDMLKDKQDATGEYPAVAPNPWK
jgi:flagellar biosynthesis/type III secretory pathway protein FliH